MAALVGTAASLAAVPAMAVTFDFSFTNALYGGGLIEGTISNLANDATSPGEVVVTANPDGFGVGAYNGNTFNSFTVSNGAIVGFNYLSFGIKNDDPTGCCSLAFSSDEGAGLSNVADDVAKSAAITFTAAPGPAPIPLPAPFVLLVGALGLLAAVARLPSRARA